MQVRQGGSKAVTEPREGVGRERVIFVCRKERGKVESRINKQTLELQHEFLDLLPRNQVDFATFKKESLPRKDRDGSPTDRYEHELVAAIAHQQLRKPAF